MKAWTALVVDLDREHEWSKRLCEILTASDGLRYDLQFDGEDEHRLHSSTIRVSVRVGTFSAALTFLTATRVPEGDWLGELLATLRQRSRGPPSIIVTSSNASKEEASRDAWLPR